ncbi:MAG: hypothetical protein ACR2M9_04350 [Cyanophyceae cyanobacterium]
MTTINDQIKINNLIKNIEELENKQDGGTITMTEQAQFVKLCDQVENLLTK